LFEVFSLLVVLHTLSQVFKSSSDYFPVLHEEISPPTPVICCSTQSLDLKSFSLIPLPIHILILQAT
jgi:hypothetical protein